MVLQNVSVHLKMERYKSYCKQYLKSRKVAYFGTRLSLLQTKEAQLKVAEMELSKVDNKTKLETTLQEEAAIRQDNKDREMERLADAAEKAARVTTLIISFYCSGKYLSPSLNFFLIKVPTHDLNPVWSTNR